MLVPYEEIYRKKILLLHVWCAGVNLPQEFLRTCGIALRTHVEAATGAVAAGLAAAGVEVGLPPEALALVAVVVVLERCGSIPSGSAPHYMPGVVLDVHNLAAF